MLKSRVELGSTIQKLRVAQGLSVRKFALMIEMDYSYISAVENGRANATVDSLYKIANGLGVSIKDLF
ncbi:helix-turn-helix domain-containing protein [Arabiibacter massiliensis]|uniref:helix-turn-helix domain-containing protein n=1 Tax=Arabiibacter massiliensis TaxID=1870985 RepID=UPI0038994D43